VSEFVTSYPCSKYMKLVKGTIFYYIYIIRVMRNQTIKQINKKEGVSIIYIKILN